MTVAFPIRDLLIATHNPGKILELRQLLANQPLTLHGLDEFPDSVTVAETGTTFAENAQLKAVGYARQAQMWTLADDSGLEADALGGAPGVLSARYAGAEATDRERIVRLLQELGDASEEKRSARFVCALALADADGNLVHLTHGICYGKIAFAIHGTQGFGYDPVFTPDGYDLTFGQLSADVKNSLSHRTRALKEMRDFLQPLYAASTTA